MYLVAFQLFTIRASRANIKLCYLSENNENQANFEKIKTQDTDTKLPSNPWNVSNVSEFLKWVYCCPECEFSSIGKHNFCLKNFS